MIGHEAARTAWHEALAGARLHHAWLLTGRKGLGKAAFARQAARELVGARQGSGDHPDILHLTHAPKDDKEERKRADGKPFELARSIRISQVRAMQQRLTTRPTLGDRRAIIIDPADDLERNAANALLKSLEEPPAGTIFFLVCHRPARLLPTIRSRCRSLRFPEVAEPELARLLTDLAPHADAATREAAIAAAGGSPGAALAFVEMDLGRIAGMMRTIAQQGDSDFRLRGALAEAIGARPDRERVQAVLDLARAIVADGAAHGQDDPRPLIDAHGELVRLTAEAPTYNYDPGLLAMEIGTLLASVAASSTRRNG